MKTADRIEFFGKLLETFLAGSKEKGYIVFAVAGKSDEYVQYAVHSDGIYGEVGSRQWTEPERPLPATAVEALGRLGFTGGGAEKNFARDALPGSPAELAELADSLFHTAYGVDDGFSPVVHEISLNDITLPRAEPFTRELIEAHLHDRQVQFLRDEAGDFRVDLTCEGSDELVSVWFVAEGDGDTTYRISGFGPHRPVPSTRLDALERCNAWNSEHRWPNAVVVDLDDGWWIAVHSNIDLAAGVTRPLFESVTKRIVYGILEFWTWIAAPSDSSTDDQTDGQVDEPPRASGGSSQRDDEQS
jgi:hypothetical protein